MNLPLLTRQHPYQIARTIRTLRGARVCFVNLPVREQALPNIAPLGPALLAARLEELGATVRILDLNCYRPVLTLDEAEALIEDSLSEWGDQDLIGLSGLITTLRWQTDIARVIRKHQPKTLLISGGGLATEFREHLLKWIPQLDGIAHSEGDDVCVKMVYDALAIRKAGRRSAEASGLLRPYYNGEKFVYAGDRPPDLDRLPFPAWHLLDKDVNGYPILESYLKTSVWGTDAKNSSATPFTMKRSINTVSSRGCPFSCRFCFRGAQGERNYGVRSAENLAAEMRTMVERHGIDFMGITDDNFMVQPKRIAALPEVLPGVRWGTHGRLDEAADMKCKGTPRVEHMAQAGCCYIGFGAESASPKVLEAMGKGGFILSEGTERVNGYDLPRTMLEGIRRTAAAGIHSNCTWICGYPGETLEDLKHTVAFILWQCEQGVANRSLFVATAYPGTELFREPKVVSMLSERFGLSFKNGEPVYDEAMRRYVLELNDATKLLSNEDGEPLNFGEMPDDLFMRVREMVEADDLEGVMDLDG